MRVNAYNSLVFEEMYYLNFEFLKTQNVCDLFCKSANPYKLNKTSMVPRHIEPHLLESV